MITLGSQYYRAPFPESRYWEDDLKRMADSGLNTVQLWVVWGWVEPEPGQFRFDDYDRLVSLAHESGLDVVLSTIAAIHPYWIHDEVPGSEMVDHMGHTVISSNRGETHFGLTPGGCFDHPGVWERIAAFLTEVVTRYRSASHLRGWDAWNELRWNVQADGLVCNCPHSLRRYRDWLSEQYGGLDGLNRAWKRRYRAWSDVRPGKMPNRPYTEMMAFEHFNTWKANDHGKRRYDLIKALDPERMVTVHAGTPSVLSGFDFPGATAVGRGNDWDFADHLDGIGCSSFPVWQQNDAADFAARLDFVHSAARGREQWLSELQGGRASIGFDTHEPVPAVAQQRWIWTALSRGIRTVLFWCWRDEVFGRESGGFGLVGRDGFADERLQAMRKTAGVLTRHEKLLSTYRPELPTAGVLFSPQSYYLYWAQEGNARVCERGVQGYARALLRRNIPFRVIEEGHLDELATLKILFMPRAVVVDDEAAAKLIAFVKGGGVLVCEAECGAFDRHGLYRYPEDRFGARLTGVVEKGRRTLRSSTFRVRDGDISGQLPATQWTTPYDVPDAAQVLGGDEDGPLLVRASVGEGTVIFCGSYLGDTYYRGSRLGEEAFASAASDVERLIGGWCASVGVKPSVIVEDEERDEPVLVRHGRSAGRTVAFVFFPEGCQHEITLRFPSGTFGSGVRELLSASRLTVEASEQGDRCVVPAGEWRMAVLASDG